jgi:hypothetical protein
MAQNRLEPFPQHPPAYEPLLSVGGIETILAQTIVLETGDMDRFPTVGNDASYYRCVTRTQISNGKWQGHGNVKNGHPFSSGPLWKQPSLLSASAQRCSGCINANMPKAI